MFLTCRGFLGFLHREKQFPLDDLSLKLGIPSKVHRKISAWSTQACTSLSYDCLLCTCAEQPLKAASLTISQEREGVTLAFEYLQWLVTERGISPQTEGLVVRSIMAAGEALARLSQVANLLHANDCASNLGTQPEFVNLCLRTAKFLYHAESEVRPREGDKAYSDLLVIRELRNLSNSAKTASKVAPCTQPHHTYWCKCCHF